MTWELCGWRGQWVGACWQEDPLPEGSAVLAFLGKRDAVQALRPVSFLGMSCTLSAAVCWVGQRLPATHCASIEQQSAATAELRRRVFAGQAALGRMRWCSLPTGSHRRGGCCTKRLLTHRSRRRQGAGLGASYYNAMRGRRHWADWHAIIIAAAVVAGGHLWCGTSEKKTCMLCPLWLQLAAYLFHLHDTIIHRERLYEAVQKVNPSWGSAAIRSRPHTVGRASRPAHKTLLGLALNLLSNWMTTVHCCRPPAKWPQWRWRAG